MYLLVICHILRQWNQWRGKNCRWICNWISYTSKRRKRWKAKEISFVHVYLNSETWLTPSVPTFRHFPASEALHKYKFRPEIPDGTSHTGYQSAEVKLTKQTTSSCPKLHWLLTERFLWSARTEPSPLGRKSSISLSACHSSRSCVKKCTRQQWRDFPH